MRDLPFLLRLHALPPLARPSGAPRKPYLPLEVRYLIRPSEEVFLYLSNNSDNKTWGDDLSLFGTRERIATFIPSTGNIPLLLKFLPMPAECIYSYLTNDYVFLGMLCRRGLACHYLPLYEARWRPPYEYPAQENIALPKTELDEFVNSIYVLLFILSVLGVGCVVCYDLVVSNIELFGLTR